MNTISIAPSPSAQSTAALKRELKAAEARKRTMALLLITPLAVFLLLIFVVPIATLLTRAVKNPEVSAAMLSDKVQSILSTGAEVCTACDNSCLLHIYGALHRQRTGIRTMHLAEILAAE